VNEILEIIFYVDHRHHRPIPLKYVEYFQKGKNENWDKSFPSQVHPIRLLQRNQNLIPYTVGIAAIKIIRKNPLPMLLLNGLEGRGSRVRFPAGAGNFSLHHRVQNGSYPMGTRSSSPGDKVDEA
jgi:hypothetical protein